VKFLITLCVQQLNSQRKFQGHRWQIVNNTAV